MGLDVSHDCFTGAYSAFNRFRQSVAKACGGSFPPHAPDARDDHGNLLIHDHWYFEADDVPAEHHGGMRLFLAHSDCDGDLDPAEASAVAAFLEWAAPRMEGAATGHLERNGSMAGTALRFAAGCREAAAAGETVTFG